MRVVDRVLTDPGKGTGERKIDQKENYKKKKKIRRKKENYERCLVSAIS